MNILITSIGKRVQLIKYLKQYFNIIGVDAGELTPAKSFVDKFYKIPKASEEDKYINSLLAICKEEKVDVLVPLYEGEFKILCEKRKCFGDLGTLLLLSSKQVLDICKDKYYTYEYFKKTDVKVPKVYAQEEIAGAELPVIIKPKDGMGSSNVFKANNIREVQFFSQYVKNSIVQQYIEGEEYTVDALVDLSGNPVYIVPRKRLEVRAGEVVKSSTTRDVEIINETVKVIKHLNTAKDSVGLAAVGPLTIQFFRDKNNEIYLLEINPRFGGGVPLSFKAGADYGMAIMSIKDGKKLKYVDEFDEVTMLRYDEAIYIE
ncbi:ATP-grasp domain-containing protein [Inconstantimicrobium mannanitabidum]|uniref:Carbamoyl phosphate synthase n=1 Tax=Inconstantimicrobium mannanitabidum TaxID=1604901 RepID=A0ACB5R8F4_9CLOT|nr:ATP-grasp domain-containing protein [Clostridium sp. TW13]GKX65474.1 carbamoyl phosphate synthase [Clostridium sp. TW13]